MNNSNPLPRYLPPVFLASSLFVVYLHTMAPGLSWANQGADGGDLITAAVVGGVAHPTGYPVYLLLARLFQFLPIESLAYRTNIMSAVFAVCAAVLVYGVVAKSLLGKRIGQYWLPGIIAGYSFGLAPLVWSQAVITEVYTLHAFFMALLLFLVVGVFAVERPCLDRLRGVVLGLAMGNHITSILLLPVALWAGSLEKDGAGLSGGTQWAWMKSVRWTSLWRQTAWMLAGMSVYIILPLRAASSPAVNWENPVNARNFWRLVSGQLYQAHYLQTSSAVFGERIQALAALLLEQIGLLGLLVGVIGAVVFFQASRLYIVTLWCFFSFSIFAFGYRTADSYLYLIPAFISVSIWIGLGVGGLLEMSKNRLHNVVMVAAFAFLLYVLGLSLANYQVVDASRDYRAENFGKEVMEKAPADAIVFAEGDQAVFALWYFRFALKERPDLAVIATDLLHYDWYQEGIRLQYPSLILPSTFLWEEIVTASNPQRPVCYVKYEDRTYIHCDRDQPAEHSP
ncbi:MAG: DUF2723 domain-containing protein [Chloroflexi bacterium]|nr:DUF2723 domain-containing protein [Chloroflexota bacterium]